MKLHQGTWGSVEGLRNIISTAGGSLTGAPLGDIVFTVAMVRVLSRVREMAK